LPQTGSTIAFLWLSISRFISRKRELLDSERYSQEQVKVKREVSAFEARGALQQADRVFHHQHHHLKAQQIEQSLTVIDHNAFYKSSRSLA
jgi:hypothetical protein